MDRELEVVVFDLEMKIKSNGTRKIGKKKLGHCKGLQLKVFANCGRDKKPVTKTGFLKAI
jgi:hypothetical protein